MDWTALKTKALELKDRGKVITDKVLPYVEKVTKFTEAQFQATPLVLKNLESFEAEKKAKKYLVLALDSSDESYAKLMLRYPLFASKAWTMNATLRVVDASLSPDLVVGIKLITLPVLIIHYQGVEYQRATGLDAILAWFDHPCFYDDAESDDVVKKEEVTETQPT